MNSDITPTIWLFIRQVKVSSLRAAILAMVLVARAGHHNQVGIIVFHRRGIARCCYFMSTSGMS
ncbi:MAG: hypothetical protein HRU23_00080 [Gammaproteobacteria bacterium]|nr:hypothetical protein [Gammaproteobacteria bacterium]